MNMTLDGYCDHTVMTADDEIHEHYNELIRSAGAMIWGRITYELMESYWPTVVEQPTGNEPTDEFAALIDEVPKLVFSNTLDRVTWRNTRLATRSIEEEILELKQQPGKDIFVGSPSLIVEATNLNLVDEFQLSIQPIIVGDGLQLFRNLTDRVSLRLLRTKTFHCGAVTHYYATKLNS